MDIQKIEQDIKDALRRAREMEQKIKEDLRQSEIKKRHFRELKKSIEHAMSQPVGATAGSGLLFLIEILSKMKHDRELIEINQKKYRLEEIGTLAQIGGERLDLIREARKSGLELSDEAQKMLQDDKLGLLLDDKKVTELFETPAGAEQEKALSEIEERDQDMRSQLEKIEEKHERAEEEMI